MICNKCEQNFDILIYHPVEGSLCNDCIKLSKQYLVDSVQIINGKACVQPLVFSKEKGLDWLYILFDRKYNFTWTRHYDKLIREGMTPLGICRTMEFILEVHKKENRHSLGLVPYYYQKAQEYYVQYNTLALKQVEQLIAQENETRVIKRRRR